jgi:hypothetical protein
MMRGKLFLPFFFSFSLLFLLLLREVFLFLNEVPSTFSPRRLVETRETIRPGFPRDTV